MTVNIKVGAELNTGDINKQLDELTRKINATGAAIAKNNGTQFQPIPKASLDMLQRVESTMRNIAKLAPQVASRLKASGQQGTGLFNVNWQKAYAQPASQNRAAAGMFTMATGLGFASSAPAPGPGVPPSHGPAPGPRPAPAPPPSGGNGGGMMANIFQQGLQAAGPIGQATSRGVTAGRAVTARGGGMGGAMSTGMGVAGGALAGMALGALISGVREYVGQAQQESIGYDTLRNQMGGRGSFNGLRDNIRRSSYETSTTFEESQHLAGLFARRGNSRDISVIGEDITQSAGFARSFGMDPASSVAAFAGMRGAGITSTADDSRRLGMSIAEGIARAGVFAKAEEFLGEIAGFGEQQTRSGMSRANVEGYTGALTGLLQQGTPGLDVGGAAAILGQANSAIARGGAAGEAGQAFLYQTLGRSTGLGPLQVHALQEGGAFGSGQSVFGPGSTMGAWAEANGGLAAIGVPEAVAADPTTNFTRLQTALRSRYPDHQQRLSAMGHILGLSPGRTAAMDRLQPAELTGIAGLLTPEQQRGLSATGIQATARIATGSRQELEGIASEFSARTGRDRLTDDERRRLEEARNGGDPEVFRRILAEISAGRHQESTQGSDTLRSMQNMEKSLQTLATGLIDPINTTRDALLRLAGRNGRSATAGELRQSRVDAELASINEEQAAAVDPLTAEIHTARGTRARAQDELLALGGTPSEAAARERLTAAEQQVRDLEARRAGIVGAHDARRQAVRDANAPPAASTGERAALPPTAMGRAARFAQMMEGHGWTPAQANGLAGNAFQESGANPQVRPGDNGISFGTMQWNRDRVVNYQREMGHHPQVGSLEDHARFTDWELRNTHRAHGNRLRQATTTDEAARIGTQFLGPADRNGTEVPMRQGHARDIDAYRARQGATPMPPGAPTGAVGDAAPGGGAPARVQGQVQGTFRLEDMRGREMAAPITVSTNFRQPQPYGATG